MSEESRTFSKTQKDALFLAADGKSDLSGEPLAEDWHADHRIPWSAGGKTDVANAQALTAKENLSKGASTLILRAWQEEFIERFQSHSENDFLLCALPGGGKTIAALHCARDWVSAGNDRKIIVVVPTRYLKKQWRDEAWALFRLNLQTEEFKGTLKNNFHGAIVTYSAIARSPNLFRRLCSMHQTFALLDEIHHAGEKASWGETIQDALECARQRLCLSGTPFRSDGKKIPFLKLTPDGTYEVHYQYDYPRALRDDVVRSVSFHRYSGEVTIAQGDDVWSFHTDDELDESETGMRLRGLLRHPVFTGGLLKEAHQKLLRVREFQPDAGALAVCMTTEHAQAVAGLLQKLTGELPPIVVADEDMNTGSIDQFRKSTKPWLVAVRMVSEGVDIKRLMILAYLTNVKTPMSFRQTIGRIVRRASEEDFESYCVMPDDRDLSAMARVIEDVQLEHLITDDDAPRQAKLRLSSDRVPSDFTVIDASSPEFAGAIMTGRIYDAPRAAEISTMAAKYSVPENKVAAIIDELLSAQQNQPRAPFPKTTPHPEDELKRLRQQIHKLAKRLAFKGQIDFSEIHVRYKRDVDPTSTKMMTRDQLERKLQWLKTQLTQPTLI